MWRVLKGFYNRVDNPNWSYYVNFVRGEKNGGETANAKRFFCTIGAA